jgi:hypothetical protein
LHGAACWGCEYAHRAWASWDICLSVRGGSEVPFIADCHFEHFAHPAQSATSGRDADGVYTFQTWEGVFSALEGGLVDCYPGTQDGLVGFQAARAATRDRGLWLHQVFAEDWLVVGSCSLAKRTCGIPALGAGHVPLVGQACCSPRAWFHAALKVLAVMTLTQSLVCWLLALVLGRKSLPKRSQLC